MKRNQLSDNFLRAMEDEAERIAAAKVDDISYSVVVDGTEYDVDCVTYEDGSATLFVVTGRS